MNETMSGQPIFISADKSTLFIPIPRELAADVPGRCACPYCKEHPKITPKWDTLALRAKVGNTEGEHTSTVHLPDKSGLKMFGWT